MIYSANAVQASPNRCFVCETPIAGGHWFARLSMGIGPSASAARSAHNTSSPNDCRSSAVLDFRRRLGPSRGLDGRRAYQGKNDKLGPFVPARETI